MAMSANDIASVDWKTALNVQQVQAEACQQPYPCPSCGRCPTCGRGGYWTQPWLPYPTYPQPMWPTPIWCGTQTATTGQAY